MARYLRNPDPTTRAATLELLNAATYGDTARADQARTALRTAVDAQAGDHITIDALTTTPHLVEYADHSTDDDGIETVHLVLAVDHGRFIDIGLNPDHPITISQ